MHGLHLALAACAYEITAADPSWVQLTPAGQFHARDGRPRSLPGVTINDWTCDAACAAEVIALFRAQATRPVVDYEHQTIKADENGQPAPAAGWIVDLAWREGQGLFAKVEWTARATALIAGGEYRYVSPVFAFDPRSGRLQRMHMAALTNNPALDGMQELSLRAAARFNDEEPDVDLKQLLAALCAVLGVTDATVESVITAAKVAKTRADQADTQIAALKAQAPDPAQFVPIATFEDVKGQLVALKSAAHARDVDALVAQGIADGKLLPAQKEWATNLGMSDFDMAALKGYLTATAPIPALRGTQTDGKKPDGEREGGLSETELALCTALALTPEQFKKAATA